MLSWEWQPFAELKVESLYALLALRQEVFVVEQRCAFLDADGLDRQAWHLLGWQQEKLLAYARVLCPKVKYEEPSIGRVITAPEARGRGFGRELMREAVWRTAQLFPGLPIRIGAQQRLEEFYQSFGFRTVSPAYWEDGIPHVEMVRPAAAAC